MRIRLNIDIRGGKKSCRWTKGVYLTYLRKGIVTVDSFSYLYLKNNHEVPTLPSISGCRSRYGMRLQERDK